MIRMQIVERPGMELFRVLKRAIRTKDLRTFTLERHGMRVVHNRYPGYMKWTALAYQMLINEVIYALTH